MCPQGAFTKKLSHPAPDARRPAGDRQVRPGRDQPQDDATRPIVRAETAETRAAAKDRGEGPVARLRLPGAPDIGLEAFLLAVLQGGADQREHGDRKSTRLNSSH